MNTNSLRLLLADDDDDDCFFFRQALDDLPVAVTLTIVHDGEQLMNLLHDKATDLPDILFLDLNMPLKSGLECLLEVRFDTKLRRLPVIILSTFIGPDVEEKLYRSGASHCIAKPTNVAQLKDVIQRALYLTVQEDGLQAGKDAFTIK